MIHNLWVVDWGDEREKGLSVAHHPLYLSFVGDIT